jgi:O-antigen ligase
MASRFAAFAAPLYLILCLLLGGASAAGAIANGALQAVGLVLIVLILWDLRGGSLAPEARGPIWIVLLLALLSLLSLVPLPPELWQSLPGRLYIRQGLDLLGLPPTSLPLSLDPHATIASALSVIPPAALFLLTVRLREEDRRRLPWAIIGAAMASVVLGAFQLLGGTESPLRLYEITNASSPVGFFANTNHLATLTLCALPFAGFIAARAASRGSGRAKRSSALILAVGVGLFLAVGIAAIGSLAGYGLFLPAVLATALVYRRALRGSLTRSWVIALGALFLLFSAVAVSGSFNDQGLAKKTASQSSRREMAARTIEGIKDYLPLGSGLGTFQNIYRLYDDPNRTDREYVNHTHNDYLELILELGIPGLLLVAAFILWWARRTLVVWRTDFRGADLARAATVPIAIILLHSLVDYPLRTAAIAAIFALSCALMVPYTPPVPVREPADDDATAGSGLRHLSAD